MNYLVALAVGYVLGARSGGKELDQLRRSLKALLDTDEFEDVVSAARAQLGSTLRAVATMVDGEDDPAGPGGDLVAQVRYLVSHR